jgi:hypothetical protein
MLFITSEPSEVYSLQSSAQVASVVSTKSGKTMQFVAILDKGIAHFLSEMGVQ